MVRIEERVFISSPVPSEVEQESKRICDWDIVLLKIDASCNQWPMAKVVQVHKDSEGVVRSVRLLAGKTRSGQDE